MRNEPNFGQKVLVIGLDGATFDLIGPWINEGLLPTFSHLVRNGVSGELNSSNPPISCPAWNCFMTGKNPGKLGFFNFVVRNPKTYQIMLSNYSSVTGSLWEIIGKHDKKVCVVAVPLTFPPQKVNGVMISGWPIPSEKEDYTHPASLKSKLDSIVGRYEVNETKWLRNSEEKRFLEGLYRFSRQKLMIADWLITTHDWDFFIVVFTGTDRIQHFFWRHIDPKHPKYDSERAKQYGKEIFKYYKFIDEAISKLIMHAHKVDDSTIVLIMSDHGFGPTYKHFNVNTWLMKKGLLKLKMKYFVILQASLILGKFRLKNIAQKIYSLTKKKNGSASKKVENLFSGFGWNRIDWLNTKAYSYGADENSQEAGFIFLNLKGREPEGIVEPGGEYIKLRNHAIRELSNVIRRENKDARIFRKEEIYNGQDLSLMPDILFLSNEVAPNSVIKHGSIFTSCSSDNHRKCASHRMNGIFVASGMSIRRGEKIEDAEIIDLAPTICHMLGVPIPHDVDGKVLKAIFEEDSELNLREVEYKKLEVTKKMPELSQEDEERIKEQLRALGYF